MTDVTTPDPATRRRWYEHRRPIDPHDAKSRTSAFVYGNLLVLGSLISFHAGETIPARILRTLGVTISTYLAHTFAGLLTSNWTWRGVWCELRNSAPILTSGALPVLVLWAATFGFPEAGAILLATLVAISRIGSIAVVEARLRGEPPGRTTLWAGLGVALIAMAIVLIKTALTT